MTIAKAKNSMSFIDKKLVEDAKKGIGTAKRPPTLKGTISDLINDMNIKQSAEGSVDYDDWADNLITVSSPMMPRQTRSGSQRKRNIRPKRIKLCVMF